MKIIIGIGNPGKKYERTRHNVGFMVVDALKKRGPQGVTLVKPETFVNDTGRAVLEIVGREKTDRKDFLVVCDDANLGLGKLRLRPLGSAGGHHGLESVIASLGDEGFARLRVGVANEKMPKDLESFVLEPFDKEEMEAAGLAIDRAATVCEAWIREDFAAARNQLSRLLSR